MKFSRWRLLSVFLLALPQQLLAAPLATGEVTVDAATDVLVADGVVEAVRQSEIAAQVTGRVTGLSVKAGDTVRPGQALVRIDERIAQQQALVGRSQVAALAAQLDAATKEYQRQQLLFKQGFLSQAALERVESQFKTTQAQTRAQMAESESAAVQTGLHALVAPYGGMVSKVSVELGDTASPGKPLLTIYDPAAMRVVVNVPQTRVAALRQGAATIEIPAAPPGLLSITAHDMDVLPTADPVSQMVQVRFALPAKAAGLSPGMFARARLAVTLPAKEKRLSIPTSAIFRRSELTAVYVLDKAGLPQLRLIRSGRVGADRTEVLAGLDAGEKVVLDPLAANPQR